MSARPVALPDAADSDHDVGQGMLDGIARALGGQSRDSVTRLPRRSSGGSLSSDGRAEETGNFPIAKPLPSAQPRTMTGRVPTPEEVADAAAGPYRVVKARESWFQVVHAGGDIRASTSSESRAVIQAATFNREGR